MDKLEAIVRTDIEPNVIDMKMIDEAIKDQSPKGQAGILIEQDGYDLKEIHYIRLEFLNILKIDHLWILPGLTKLQLGNNIIKKIENLDSLINLKELDLSFNNITVIENLESLVNIEKLTLFNNSITALQNLENLKKLKIFSIGNNLIRPAKSSIMYLRKFPNLKSLNMAGNPCTANAEFRMLVCAYIPQLVYYEYKLITTEESNIAIQYYLKDLEILEREENKLKKQIKDEEEAAAREALHKEAFVEQLDKDQLYEALFEKDEDGQALLLMNEEVQEIYNSFREQMGLVTSEIFELGQQQMKLRQEEISQYQNCIESAKTEGFEKSKGITEDFIKTKGELMMEMKSILASESNSVEQTLDQVNELSESFDTLCSSTWKQLMDLELTLFEQIEELTTYFERNLGDIVNTFIENVQGFFTQLREYENSFSEVITDQALRFLVHLTIRNEDVLLPPPLKAIMVDKETINNSLAASHDLHLLIIDNREDLLISQIRSWHQTLCAEFLHNEISRNRTAVMEINHFSDFQREEFEQYQKALDIEELYTRIPNPPL